jgi:type III pantothenate kinase
MILEIDAGNTALKWRVVNVAGEIISRGRQSYSRALADISKDLCGVNIKVARVACVAGRQTEFGIKEWLGGLGVLEVNFARTLSMFSGLKIAYQNPARLGVDRWLAMLAARTEQKACCVIDCGSAITVDFVNTQGSHLGGYIVPGLKTMQSGLLGNTRQIKLDKLESTSALGLGSSTSEGVNNGILRMAVSFLQSVLDDASRKGEGFHVFMTGGDMETVRPFLSSEMPIELVPELVLNGLRIALK